MKPYRTLAVFVFALIFACLSSNQLFAGGDCTTTWVASNHLRIEGDGKDNDLFLTQSGSKLIVVPTNGTELDGRSNRKYFPIKPGVTRVEVWLNGGFNRITVEGVFDLAELELSGSTSGQSAGEATLSNVVLNELIVLDFRRANVVDAMASTLGVRASDIRADNLYASELAFIGWNIDLKRSMAGNLFADPPNDFALRSYSLSMENVNVIDQFLMDPTLSIRLIPDDTLSFQNCDIDSLTVDSGSGDDSIVLQGGRYGEMEIELGTADKANRFVANGVDLGIAEIESENSLELSVNDCVGEDLEIDNRSGQATNVLIDGAVFGDLVIDTGDKDSSVGLNGITVIYLDVVFGDGDDQLQISNANAQESYL